MPWFIVQCERKTLTKYLVEAENTDAVMDVCDNWEYLGYADGDETGETIVGPFNTKEKALDDATTYVAG